MTEKKNSISVFIVGLISLIALVLLFTNIQNIYAQTEQKSVEDYCEEAEGYWKEKKYQEAISTYQKAIELYPNNQLAYSKLEKSYLALDKFDEADSIYKTYINKMGDGELMRIIMLETFGKTDLAIANLLKMISFKPEYAPASSYLGSIYKKQGKYLRAKIYLENALNILRQQGDLERLSKVEEKLETVYAQKPEPFQAELGTFSNPREKITIMYPSDWYVKEETNGDIYAVFLSREKISKPGDIFKTGISAIKFYNADQFVFNMPPNKIRLYPDIKNASMALYIDALCTQLIMQKKLISRIPYRAKINNLPVYIAEISFKNDFGSSETMFLVVAYKDNTFVKFVLEAPIDEFEKYYPIFLKVIENAKLF
jgi:tetratricopeptide (TPR) repeat protein